MRSVVSQIGFPKKGDIVILAQQWNYIGVYVGIYGFRGYPKIRGYSDVSPIMENQMENTMERT